MDRLIQMKEMLVSCIEGQMTHLDSVDTKELGEAIDMVKDLSEAIYYCTITEAMENKEKEDRTMYYPVMYYGEPNSNGTGGKMYYEERGNSHRTPMRDTGAHWRDEREMPLGEAMRDHREGRSPMNRKMYMESKEMHKDKSVQLQELEKYAQELTSDLIEMVEGASPEEKQFLSNKIAALATKIK
jgi:hypothetical protein